MRISMLGTSHGAPEPNRRCACYLLESGGQYYVFDAGTQFVEDLHTRRIPAEAVKLVICSHPHGDHTDGLISFVDLMSWFYRKVPPMKVLVPSGALIEPMSQWIAATGTTMRGDLVSVYGAGVVFDDGRVKVTAYPTLHCGDSYGFVIEAEGRRILYTGDMSGWPADDMEALDPGPGFDLALCEAAHFSPALLPSIFDGMGVREVYLVHVYPGNYPEAYRLQKEDHPCEYRMAYDGMELVL